MRRVVKRTQHAGDIDQSRTFQSASPIGLPGTPSKFRINKVLPSEQKLAQMVISVNPNFLRIDRVAKKLIVRCF
jgi:hypothetical protein